MRGQFFHHPLNGYTYIHTTINYRVTPLYTVFISNKLLRFTLAVKWK